MKRLHPLCQSAKCAITLLLGATAPVQKNNQRGAHPAIRPAGETLGCCFPFVPSSGDGNKFEKGGQDGEEGRQGENRIFGH